MPGDGYTSSGVYSGGHRGGTGIPGKTEFPPHWTDTRIINAVSEVATSPTSTIPSHVPPGHISTGFTAAGNPARYPIDDIVDGVAIRVIYESQGRLIVSGYPTNIPANP
jgi:hypothetical protein